MIPLRDISDLEKAFFLFFFRWESKDLTAKTLGEGTMEYEEMQSNLPIIICEGARCQTWEGVTRNQLDLALIHSNLYICINIFTYTFLLS